MKVACDGWCDQFARAPANRASSQCHEIRLDSLLESYSCRGRVAQLGEHLLCKHAFISSKPLNRRLFTVQNPLLVGLPIGLQEVDVLRASLDKRSETCIQFESSKYSTGRTVSATVLSPQWSRPERRTDQLPIIFP
jgi:hypothetical protein